MNLLAAKEATTPGTDRFSGRRLWLFALVLALTATALLLGFRLWTAHREADRAQQVVRDYLEAVKTGDMERARSYWTDLNRPDGGWTLVPRRDMEHVTQEHSVSFAGGVEIVKAQFQTISDAQRHLGVLRSEVRVQPGDAIRKLEVGLVKRADRWYIYSIYPGTW